MRKLTLITLCGLVLLAGPATAELQTAIFADPVALTIPDDSFAVSAVLPVALPHYIASIRVYVDLATNAASDLEIWVESPYGTSVLLMDHGSGHEPEVNPIGWYPDDFAPSEDMEQWIGEGASGTWTVYCQDTVAGGGNATLMEWGIEIGYEDSVADDQTTWGAVKTLYR